MSSRLKNKWLSISILIFSMLVSISNKGLAARGNVPVSRSDMLDVAKELHPPGCTDSMTADYCMLSTGYDVRQEITSLLESGLNKEQVIDSLVQKYGERILASPSAEGFNLLVWILPGFGILLGALLIVLLIKKWKRGHESLMQSPQHTDINAGDASKVHEELKNWL